MIDDVIIESYLDCKYKAYRKINNEFGLKNEFETLYEEELSKCKTGFYNHLLEKYGKNKLLSGFKFGNNKIISEVNFLVSPTLNAENFQVSFDAIEIVQDKKSTKKLFIPILITHKEKYSKKEKLSITIKCSMLHKTYGIDCAFGRIIYGSKFKKLKFKIEPFLTEAKKILSELSIISSDNIQYEIFQKNHCKICEFQKKCEEELIEKDGLGLLHGMNEEKIKKLNKRGIFTVNQLSFTFRQRKKPKRTKKHPYLFSLQALALREHKVYLYDKMRLPVTKKKVFIDMEGNSDGSFIYLIGLLIIEDEKEIRHTLWANNFKEEKQIFNKFIKIITDLDDCNIFYYGKYESKVFKRILKSKYSKKVKDLLKSNSTNILSAIYSNIYFPTHSNSLKEIGKYLGCNWSVKNASGIQAIVWRNKWEKSNDIGLKNILITYNYEDCIALKIVTDFIYKIFNQEESNNKTDALQNIVNIEKIQFEDEHRLPIFRNLVAATEDIEVINKCAYFEYQRNKIYLRSNKNIKNSIKRRKKQEKIIYRPNKKIEIKSYTCPKCKSKEITKNENNIYTKTNYDLRFFKYGIKRWITEYFTYQHKCQKCKKSYIPQNFMKIYVNNINKSPPKYYMKQERWGYGRNLLAWVIHQNMVNGIPFRHLARNLRDYYGIHIDYRKIWYLKENTSKWYKKTYENILKKMIKGPLIHSDETKINIKEENGYIWVFTNLEEVIYLYKSSRESNFLQDFLKDFKGVLVSDFYSGYDSLDCPQQKCLIHLIRDLNDTLLKNPFDTELKEFVILFGQLLREVIVTIDRFGLKSRYMKRHKKDVNNFYKWLAKQNFHSDNVEKLKKRFSRYKTELFQFLDYDNIPWNNNNAEYAIKHVASYKRYVRGPITKRGLEMHLILLSIYETCKNKGINFLDFLLSKERDLDRYIQKYCPS